MLQHEAETVSIKALENNDSSFDQRAPRFNRQDLKDIPSDWPLVPVVGKRPTADEWQTTPLDRAQVNTLLNNGRYTGVGLNLGLALTLIAIDVDGPSAEELLALISNGDSLLTVAWTSGREGRQQLLYQLPEALAERLTQLGCGNWNLREFPRDSANPQHSCSKGETLNFRFAGCQSVLPPSWHPDQKAPYYWLISPAEVAVAPAPAWLIAECERECDRRTEQAKRPVMQYRANHLNGTGPLFGTEPASKVEAALSALAGTRYVDDYDEWLKIGMALASLDSGLFHEWDRWSQGSPKYRASEMETKWKSFRGSGVGIGTLYHYANMAKPNWEPEWYAAYRGKSTDMNMPPMDAIAPPETEFPDDLVEFNSYLEEANIVDFQEWRDRRIEQPEAPTEVKIKGTDGKDSSQKNSAIRAQELSEEGKTVVAMYCQVITEKKYYNLREGDAVDRAALKEATDHLKLLEKGNWLNINGKSHKVDAPQLLEAYSRKAWKTVYEPGKPRLIEREHPVDLPYLNLWSPYPTGIPSTAADVAPWLDFLDRLWGDRKDILTWFMAHTLRRPEVKILWAPMLFSSAKQVGKQVGQMSMSWALGRDYGSPYHSALNDQFNEWRANKKFIVLNEVMPWRPGCRYPDPNHLVRVILGGSGMVSPTFTLNAKYEATRELVDFANFWLVSNEFSSFRFNEDERRLFPLVTEAKGDNKLSSKLIEWYQRNDNEGHRKVIGYLQTLDLDAYNPYSFEKFIDKSDLDKLCNNHFSESQSALADYLTDLKESGQVTTVADVQQILKTGDGKEPRPDELVSLLNELGWSKATGSKNRVGKPPNRHYLVFPYGMTFEEAKAIYLANKN